MSPTDSPALPTLQAEHAALVESAGGKVLDHLESIRKFVARVVAAGAGLDAKDDRVAAQGFINFWVARVSVAARAAPDGRRGSPGETFEETLLADPAPDLLARAVAAAEERVARLSDEDKALTRRVVLRLVRLQAAGDRFEAVPTVRAALADLDDPERVTKAIDDLAADGVVRVTKGEPLDLDRVALRSPDLLTRWPSLVAWQAHRLKLRTAVREWAASGKPAEKLAVGEDLEDARRYHDRNTEERDYVTASAYRQARQVEQAEHYRRRMWVFAGVAGVLLVGSIGLLVLGLGWWATAAAEGKAKVSAMTAANDAKTAKEAAEEAKNNALLAAGEEKKAKEAAVKEKKAADAATNALRRRQELSSLRLLLRTLAEVSTARNLSERDAAIHEWATFARQIATEDVYASLRGRRGLDPQALLKQAASTDDRKLSGEAIEAIRRMKVEGQEAAETGNTLRSIRTMSFSQVEHSAAQIVKLLEADKSYAEVEPYFKVFWSQYWGEMILVESEAVEDQMVKFGAILRRIREEFDKPNDDLKRRLEESAKVLGDDWKKFSDDANRLNVQKMAELKEKYVKLPADELNRLLRAANDRPLANRKLVGELKDALPKLRDALNAEGVADNPIPTFTGSKY